MLIPVATGAAAPYTPQRPTPHAIPLAANWTSYASPYGPCTWYMDDQGVVTLHGLAQWNQGINPEGQTMVAAGGVPVPAAAAGVAGAMWLPFSCPASVAPLTYSPYLQGDGSIVARGVGTAGPWASGWFGLNGIRYVAA